MLQHTKVKNLISVVLNLLCLVEFDLHVLGIGKCTKEKGLSLG